MNSHLSCQYAQSLFNKTIDSSTLVLVQFEDLCSIFNENSSVDLFFAIPSLGLEQKKALLQDIFSRVDFSVFLKSLFSLLVKKGAFHLRNEILNHYRVLKEKQDNILQATIEVSGQENKDTVQSIKETFQKLFNQRKIIWKLVRNDCIIAGFSVFIEGKCYQAGLYNQLQKMRSKFIS